MILFSIDYDSQSIWKLSNIFWAEHITVYNLPLPYNRLNTTHLVMQSVKAVPGASTHPKPHPNALASLFSNSAHSGSNYCRQLLYIHVCLHQSCISTHVTLWVCCISESLGFLGLYSISGTVQNDNDPKHENTAKSKPRPSISIQMKHWETMQETPLKITKFKWIKQSTISTFHLVTVTDN